MTTLDYMTDILKDHPFTRERVNKNKTVARMLQKKYPNELEHISLQRIEDMIVDAHNLDRAWRKVLQDNPSLRGSDYEEKVVLEQKKELELGYTPGFAQDVKRLANVS